MTSPFSCERSPARLPVAVMGRLLSGSDGPEGRPAATTSDYPRGMSRASNDLDLGSQVPTGILIEAVGPQNPPPSPRRSGSDLEGAVSWCVLRYGTRTAEPTVTRDQIPMLTDAGPVPSARAIGGGRWLRPGT